MEGKSIQLNEGSKTLLNALNSEYGSNFWDHLCVINTRWGYGDDKVYLRKCNNISEDSRKAEIKQLIENGCPSARGHNIPVYFTDVFEMKMDKKDPTSDTMRTIWLKAAKKHPINL